VGGWNGVEGEVGSLRRISKKYSKCNREIKEIKMHMKKRD
jgi:hypothetical protein